MNNINNRLDLDEITANVESFKADIFYPSIHPTKTVQTFIENISDIKYLKTLSNVELAEFSVLLSKYALDLTLLENKLKSYIGLCEGNIKYIVGRNLDKTSYTWFQEKVDYIISNEPQAMELDKNRMMAKIKLDMISFLSNKISYLSETIKDLRFARYKEYKGEE